MKNKFPAWLVLTVICIVAALLLAATNLATKDVIAENARKEAMATLAKLMPDAADFETLESGVTVGKDGSGNPVGYLIPAVTQGFGGEVETTVAIGADGLLRGISVGGSNFAETAGLGARAKEPEFQAQFAGKAVPVALTKDGGEIEALSGATITSRAVIKGVNEAATAISEVAGFEVKVEIEAEHIGENRYTATAPGFGGPVRVFLDVDGEKNITAVEIGDSQFAETDGLGKKAQEPAFRDQFIGKTLPVTADQIEALSGATITTNAVLEAMEKISTALDQGLADSPVAEFADEGGAAEAEAAEPAAAEAAETTETAAEEAAGTTETAAEEAAETAAAAGGSEHSATAQGFAGPVKVTLTLDENRTITAIEIGDEAFNETEGLGKKALEPAFRDQFIGKTLPVTADQIDALAGATITTGAVLDAIAQIDAEAGTAGETAEPAAEEAAETAAGGTEYSATAQGFAGPVKVTLTLDENRTITAIEIGDEAFNETEGLGKKALEPAFRDQFIGKTLPVTADQIDALAGATITTGAVLDAIAQIDAGAGTAAAEAAETAAAAGGTEYSATAQGFGGPVKVTLTLDENRTINAIEIGDEAFNETEGVGSKAKEPAFRNQFVGKTLPVTADQIEALAGATITTGAVLDAISQIGVESGAVVPESTEPETEPAPELPSFGEDVKFVPGTYEGEGQGWSDNVKVTVKITVDEQGITAAEIAGEEEIPFGVAQFEKYAAELAGRRDGNIDAVTNATMTRNGVREAVWNALEQAVTK